MQASHPEMNVIRAPLELVLAQMLRQPAEALRESSDWGVPQAFTQALKLSEGPRASLLSRVRCC